MAVYQVGEKFRESKRKSVAVFECECKKRFIGRVDMRPVSCGCQTKANQSRAAKKRKANRTTHGASSTRLYKAWAGMIGRCTNKNNKAYQNYGGRGIAVCDRWRNSFEAFRSDMGQRPHGMSLDRINNDGNYDPSNCRWASSLEQSCNRRSSVKTTINGVEKTASEWAKEPGAKDRKQIANLIRQGFSGEEAVFARNK